MLTKWLTDWLTDWMYYKFKEKRLNSTPCKHWLRTHLTLCTVPHAWCTSPCPQGAHSLPKEKVTEVELSYDNYNIHIFYNLLYKPYSAVRGMVTVLCANWKQPMHFTGFEMYLIIAHMCISCSYGQSFSPQAGPSLTDNGEPNRRKEEKEVNVFILQFPFL